MRLAHFLVITLGVISLVAVACTDEEAGAGRTPTPEVRQLESETLVMGDQSGIELGDPQVFKIDSPDAWQELWARHNRVTQPSPQLPGVAFEREMVIAVVDRQQPSGGYSLEIRSVRAEGRQIKVSATRREPGPGCITTSVITQPFHFVTLDTVEGEPLLAVSTEQYECER